MNMKRNAFGVIDLLLWLCTFIIICVVVYPVMADAETLYYKDEVVIRPKHDYRATAQLNGFFPEFVKLEDGLYKFVPKGVTVNTNTRVLATTLDNPCDKIDTSKYDCDPNYYVTTSDSDPLASDMWGLTNIKVQNGRNLMDSTAVVAVIDTGVDPNHPDLLVDTIRSKDITCNNCPISDKNGHGTHVAGTVGAIVNNGLGVAGVSERTSIIAVRVLGADGSGSLNDVIKGVEYVTKIKKEGVNVLVANMSLGGGGRSVVMEKVLADSINAGVFYAVAAGNEHANIDRDYHFPASYQHPGMAAIASITVNNTLSSFSNYGQKVLIAAPGSNIMSTWPGGGYKSISGTSMATPHVAGAAAIYRVVTGANPAETKTALKSKSRVLPDLKGKIETGATLDLEYLIANATPTTEPTPEATPNKYRCKKTYRMPLRHGWPKGTVWKNPAENGGTVFLTPEAVPVCNGDKVTVLRGDTPIGTLNYTGHANGNRAHYRDTSRTDWPTECRIKVFCELDMGTLCWKLPNGNKTFRG